MDNIAVVPFHLARFTASQVMRNCLLETIEGTDQHDC